MKTVFKWMLRAVKGLLMGFGIVFLLMVVGVALLVGKLSEGSLDSTFLIHADGARQVSSIPDNGILFVDFAEPLAQRKVDDRLARFLGPSFMDPHTLAMRIHHAATDKRIRGLVVDLRGDDLSLADRDALLGAVKAFRDQGKKTTAYLDTFDFGARGLVQYMTASAFDRIVMHASGTVSLTGLAAEAPFFKTALKSHLGVEPQFFRFSENKTGANAVMEDAYTPEHRATLQAYLASLSGIMTDRIMAARGWDKATMDGFFSRALIPADEAKTLGLVEETSSFETFLETSRSWVVSGGHETESPQDGTYIDVHDYDGDRPQAADAVMAADAKAGKSAPLNKDKKAPESIALIYAEGPIMDGYDPEDSPFGASGNRVYALTLAQQIQEAVDDDVKAIVLRVDSPGGSYTASHVLRDAVLSAKAQGIPVIISIKDMAASGGYFLSMDANAIVAPETSLVGSIGVFGGKFVTAGLSEKLDVKWDRVVMQPHALMWSSQTPFDAAESTIVSGNLKGAYDTFGGLVKAGRKLTDAQATKAIGGQFFTGRDALSLHLIDKIGGLEDAITEAAKHARLDRRAVTVVVYPKIEDMLAGFLRFVMGGIGSSQAHTSLMNAALMGLPAEGALYATMLDVYQQPTPLAVLPPVRIAGQWMGWSDR
ncbi:MAG: S49 family peptidase [Alphaproteobacteria bacterium]